MRLQRMNFSKHKSIQTLSEAITDGRKVSLALSEVMRARDVCREAIFKVFLASQRRDGTNLLDGLGGDLARFFVSLLCRVFKAAVDPRFVGRAGGDERNGGQNNLQK